MSPIGNRGRFALVVLAALTLVLWPGTAAAARPGVAVTGGGIAMMTYTATDLPRGPLPVTFAIAAVVAPDRPGRGQIEFLFLGPAAHAWGANPSVDMMRLTGTVTTGTIAPNGKITLAGTLTEIDRVFGEGVVFTEVTTFSIQVGGELGPNAFVLQWCELQPFRATVHDGSLRVTPARDRDRAGIGAADPAGPGGALYAQAAGSGCAR